MTRLLCFNTESPFNAPLAFTELKNLHLPVRPALFHCDAKCLCNGFLWNTTCQHLSDSFSTSLSESFCCPVPVSSFLSLISSILQRLVKHAAKFRRTHKKVFKKKKKFKDSEKVCLRKRKICMWPLCPCRFFCIFVGIAKGMNDFICRLCVRSVQTFKFN